VERVSNQRAGSGFEWQSKIVLLLVLPWAVVNVLLQSHWWITQVPVVAWTTLGISGIFGLVVWRMRAGTAGAAAIGAAITASLMYGTTRFPYEYSCLHGGLPPLLAVFLLTFAATKIGKEKKERLGTGEDRRGRNTAQVAANLGVAALAAVPSILNVFPKHNAYWLVYLPALAALAEAAADTVSSEIGQVLGGQPRLLTTFGRVEPGTDGGITFAGTAAGVLAAMIVAAVGAVAAHAGWLVFWLAASGGVFGLLFDSLLGATLERKGWLNNDAVNFLSTLSAAVFAVSAFGLLTNS
jgi:uncharacterized protein (TIGR00297 family)